MCRNTEPSQNGFCWEDLKAHPVPPLPLGGLVVPQPHTPASPPPHNNPRPLFPAASGSAPLIALQRYQDGGIRVACRSAGWFPQPQLLWRDPHGQWLPSLSENITQDGGGLYTAESVLILAGGVSQELACVVRAALHNQEKESAFSIAGKWSTVLCAHSVLSLERI